MTRTTISAEPGNVQSEVAFDEFADDYDASLQLGLHATGENKAYFMCGRLNWLKGQLADMRFDAHRVLDFGCGRGDTCPLFFDVLPVQSYVGVDVSVESLRLADAHHGNDCRRFLEVCHLTSSCEFDLAYCNGVFHHIPPAERLSSVRSVARCLRPNGLFAFWENNPWNPGTRWVMRRIPFDRDAIMLSAREARHLLRAAGFEILTTSYLFVFPHRLRWLRRLESSMASLPIGGQYQILARLPARDGDRQTFPGHRATSDTV